MIEDAYRLSESLGLALWNQDEAGPYQAIPQPGSHWCPAGEPLQYPHEYIRGGTAKLLTLFHPATGEVRVKGVESTANVVLHPWLKEELDKILTALPPPATDLSSEEIRSQWERWQEGLTIRFTLLDELPPLRMLLIWDNLSGHKSAELLCWMMARGIMPLYTPLGGSWLNMAESIQRILTRRALLGSIRRRHGRSSSGWRRPPGPGVRIPRPSSGAARAGPAGSVPAIGTDSVARAPVHGSLYAVALPYSSNGAMHAN
ncbi:MAG: transposase [Gemmatimonadota bacterium]|nr:transposase [Gemmatimonadota bacterium]